MNKLLTGVNVLIKWSKPTAIVSYAVTSRLYSMTGQR